jgi:curli production assembly/transport component CsgG
MLYTRKIAIAFCLMLLIGCSNKALYDNRFVKEANVTDHTRAGSILEKLSPPSRKIAIVVYDFQDLTGQFKNNGKYTEYSSAVTKGGNNVLVKALLDAGQKNWFTVAERGDLKNLLQERQIINQMRSEYRTADNTELPKLPPLIYGGIILEGGIISYDSNITTGGLGATYLGVAGSTKYNRDLLTVSLRAVSVQSGEVLLSVTSSKTVYSTGIDTNLLKYVTFDKLFQAEAGFTLNEPVQLAVRQAIETAVYSLIMEGAIDKLWTFRNPEKGKQLIKEYLTRRDGKIQNYSGMGFDEINEKKDDVVVEKP